MQCNKVAELIGAYLDRELDADARREVASHLGSCAACSTVADDIQVMSRQVAGLGRETAPQHLPDQVRSLLPGGVSKAGSMFGLIVHATRRWPDWVGRAAVLLLACGVTAGATVLFMSRMDDAGITRRDVAAAHVRSLLQDSPVQVASSDTHAVKPWFAGRLDFAPAVRDLTAHGFPLAGARLDFVAERRVAALVYRRRLHVVNVFLWPSADAADNAPRGLVDRGYNVVTWSKAGIVYWAISDLNMTELQLLQSLL